MTTQDQPTIHPAKSVTQPITTTLRPRSRWRRILPYLLAMGPGLLAASAGNDAGGIATYASAGADYGYNMLWAMIIVTIFVGIVQEMSARLGAVTGKGFSDLVRETFPLRMTAFILATLFVANVGIIISEFVGIAAAAELFGLSRYIAVPIAAVVIWLLITRGSYANVERVFLVLTLVFFAYIGAAFLAKPDWNEVFQRTINPHITWNSSYLQLLIAIIGTTISPYMQLYVQSSVAEKGVTPADYTYTRVDVLTGTIFAGFVASFIMIATAATLHPRGIVIETAADAAIALEPIAGVFAQDLFAIGLLGASLLAAGVLPLATTYMMSEAFVAGVLPLATTYMMSEAFGFERGVSRTWQEAPVFLGVFTGLTVIGAGLALIPNLPLIQVLVGVYVMNGLLLPIELFAILRLINDHELMGEYVNQRVYNVVAYGIAIILTILSLSLIGMTVWEWFT